MDCICNDTNDMRDSTQGITYPLSTMSCIVVAGMGCPAGAYLDVSYVPWLSWWWWFTDDDDMKKTE